MKNLEGLTEKVGTLGLQVRKRNRCGSARKRAREAKSSEAPMGATEGGQPPSAAGGQPLDFQEPGTLGAQSGRGPATSQKVPVEWGAPTCAGKTAGKEGPGEQWSIPFLLSRLTCSIALLPLVS
jgi:hypothetical protein